jgi:hypothetical protein
MSACKQVNGISDDLRYDLILQPAKKQGRHLDVGDQAVARPNLVAQIGKVLGRRHDLWN